MFFFLSKVFKLVVVEGRYSVVITVDLKCNGLVIKDSRVVTVGVYIKKNKSLIKLLKRLYGLLRFSTFNGVV